MVIIDSNKTASSNLLQVYHDHEFNVDSITSNLSTFEVQPSNKFESFTPHTENVTHGTSSECNLDFDDDIFAREGTQVARKGQKLASFILENYPVNEMITSQVRLNGDKPYVHIGVIFDDILPEKSAFDPQAIKMERPEQPSPALQRNFYFPISDHAMSTNVEFITINPLDDLI